MSKYTDTITNMNILGVLLRDPSILEDTARYQINVNDFTQRLHKIIFSSINNLYISGLSTISSIDIANYLKTSGVKDQYVTFEKEKGIEFIDTCISVSDISKLDYYYNKSKKFRYLREMQNVGFDTTTLYDPDSIDFELKEKQEKWLEEISLEDLVNTVQKKIDLVMSEFQLTNAETSAHAGDGIFELLEELKNTPAVGFPTYDPILTRVTMGMRLGKYYLISANSGVGKTRQMAAMCATMSASKKFDLDKNEWVELPNKVPSLFIATEQDLSEIQTLLLAHISGVNEEHILNQKLLYIDELARVQEAAKIIKESPIQIVQLPDFGIKDIEDAIKKSIIEHDTQVVFFDYINTSIKILSEISSKANINMREDQILYLLSTRLKELAVSYGVCVMSATQLNRSAQETSAASTGMIKGSSAIVEKADFWAILMRLTDEDKEMLPSLVSAANVVKTPNAIMSVGKNRRGKYSSGKMWLDIDLGTCTFDVLFYTDNDYELQEIEAYELNYVEE